VVKILAIALFFSVTLDARSPTMKNTALHNPIPGGTIGGWAGDTGLDISAQFLPVYAIASGTLDYSEPGHTRWTRGKDTPNSVRIKLDLPIPWKDGHKVKYVYYTHLSRLVSIVKESDTEKKHVDGGERIGVSGIGNGAPHLHVGLLLDGNVEQDSWDTLLVEGDVRKVFGGYRNGERL
jgi:murein DD-endopeptidase MepM/ murein hydrolase activator NlpD